jgi:hypothetical protein
MVKQGTWTRWEGITPTKIKWEDMLNVEPLNLQFTLKSVYDLLQTPVNLKVWNKKLSAIKEEPSTLYQVVTQL